MPKITPISAEIENAKIGASGVTIVVMPQNAEMIKGMAIPNTTPMRPPTPERITASIRNCMMMSLRFAPSARRMPGSLGYTGEHDIHDADAAYQQ